MFLVSELTLIHVGMVVVDIEASGTNFDVHSIVSIGAVDFDDPENRFYEECKIWDGAHIMDGALEVNGFTESEITDPQKQTEGELVQKFLEWSQHMRERTLVGQNVAFDRGMLEAAAHRAHVSWDIPYRTLDTHTMCYMHMIHSGKTPKLDEQHRRTDLNLDVILSYCGLPAEPRPHHALMGALLHAEVAARLLFNKKLLPEFEQYAIPWR